MQELIATLLSELLKKLDKETVNEMVDGILDKVENKIDATDTKWDNAVVQPLINAIRSLASIEDKKYGSDKEVAA